MILPGLGHFVLFLIFSACSLLSRHSGPVSSLQTSSASAHASWFSVSCRSLPAWDFLLSHRLVNHPISPLVSFPDSHGFSCMSYSAVCDYLQTTLSPAIPSPALCSLHTLWHFRMFLVTQGQVQESKCQPSFIDKRSEIINLWEEGPTSFCFCFRHLALGPGVRQCIMVRMKGIGTGLSLERKRRSRDKGHNIFCKSMPL